jgi:hypothetical protein
MIERYSRAAFTALVAFLCWLPLPAIAGWQGCYLNGSCNWLTGCDEGDPLTGYWVGANLPLVDLRNQTIDVFIDDSFTGQTSVNGLPEDLAETLVKQEVVNFHSEAGVAVTYRYRGRSTNLVCGTGTPSNFTVPTLIVNVVPPGGSLSDFCDVQANAIACADWSVDPDGTYCGYIYFLPGTQGSSTTDWFRSTVMHEMMHTLNYAHPTEDQCGSRDGWDTITHPDNTSHPLGDRGKYLSQADKRMLRDDYGYGITQEGLYWQATNQFTFDGYANFSAPQLLYSADATIASVSASDGDSHDHGFVFNEKEGRADPWLRTYLYENGVGWARYDPFASLATEDWSYYPPDLARTKINRIEPTWAVLAVGADRFADRRVDMFFAEKAFGVTNWHITRRWNAQTLDDPNVSVAYDTMSDRYVVAYTGLRSNGDNGKLRIVTLAADRLNGPTWDGFTEDPSGVRFHWGVDVACSNALNSADGLRNCVAVGLENVGPGSTRGPIVLRFFSINANGSINFESFVRARDALADTTAIFSKPRVAANANYEGRPYEAQFVYLTTDLPTGLVARSMIWDQFTNESQPVQDLQYRSHGAWDYLPAALGSHTYSTSSYLDAGYTAP